VRVEPVAVRIGPTLELALDGRPLDRTSAWGRVAQGAPPWLFDLSTALSEWFEASSGSIPDLSTRDLSHADFRLTIHRVAVWSVS
jgi:hypothetical protein